jgi:polysaccharide deacetylase 2 family uncharacterized protein YibQ
MSDARHGRKAKYTTLWVLVLVSLFAGLALIGAARLRVESRRGAPNEGVNAVAESQGKEPGGGDALSSPLSGPSPLDKRVRVALIIDDLGFSLSSARELAEVKVPLTWSIIPYQSHSLSSLKIARERGIPAMLHLPMEAEVDRAGLKYQVNLEMDSETIRGFVRRAAKSLPGVIGVNNHRGSRATSTPKVMEAVLTEVKEQGLIFVDSRTSGKSVAFRMAVEMGLPALKNEVFLDHEANAGAMRKELERAFSLARKNGSVVIIGHARPETLRFLKTLSESRPDDVKWVTVPEIIRQSPGSSQGGMSQ